MAFANENAYSESQVLTEQRESSLWRRLVYRAGIGFLVGVAIFVLVQLIGSIEKNGIDFFLLSLCVIVPTASTFTQSESAKKSGRTGIISAIMLCLASVLIASLTIQVLGWAPPNLKGYEQEWSLHEKHRLSLWIFLYAVLVCAYYLLYCRKKSPPLNSEAP